MFTCVQQAHQTPIEEARRAYAADHSKDKVDLIFGTYRTEEGKPWLMPFVRKIELQLAQDPDLNHEYTWFLGKDNFVNAAPKVILGENNAALKQNRAFGIQTLSACGGLRVGSEFLVRQLGCKTVYIPDHTWETHDVIFPSAGFTDIRYYRYWDAEKRGLHFEGFIEDLNTAPENAIILLQACCHNPTGCDPNQEQWMEIVRVMKKKHLFPFFDAAYLGFASGDIYEDAWPIRHCIEEGLELFVAMSFAKNLGLYSERVGCLIMVLADGQQELVEKIKSQLVPIIRSMYICPPKHGGDIVSAVLSSEENIKEWQECIKTMVHRCRTMRQELKKCLVNLGTPGNWDHITDQKGMICYLGLTSKQVEHLRKEHHVYVVSTGRASICRLNMSNVGKTAKAIHSAVVNIHD